MRFLVPLTILLLGACSARATSAPAGDAPPAAPAKPAAAVEPGEPLGEFAGVVANNGETRTLEDLRGQATVVWFFPAAGTPG